jgi:hypothetical protein
MQVLLAIPDASDWAVTAARQAYNANVPEANEIASDAEYINFVMGAAVTSWGREYQAVEPPPEVPPVEVEGVPQEVTMRQAQLALLGAGLLDTVEAAIAQMLASGTVEGKAAHITWTKSATVRRDNTLIATMQAQLGLTSEQVDNLFVTAAGL